MSKNGLWIKARIERNNRLLDMKKQIVMDLYEEHGLSYGDIGIVMNTNKSNILRMIKLMKTKGGSRPVADTGKESW